MKTIGMIGGMSWESSLEYYRLINKMVKEELGGLHSAKTLMYSVDFGEIEVLQHKEEWKKLTDIMIDAARRLEKGGSELLLICTNTMHKMADEVEASIGIPLLHIADAVAVSIKKQNLKKVGLLGTRFTMEQEFYKGRLNDLHGIEVVVPCDEDMDAVHNIIYNELCQGALTAESRARYLEIIEKLIASGAEGIVLGCTEIPMLIKQEHVDVPVFDTTLIHAEAAVREALNT
ncbi:MAG: aspartate/glutamate racemase family protein [Spirochaetales bacterium]|nr:aspartate/glutamate racemase family protein [Spirochaetales bacterium]